MSVRHRSKRSSRSSSRALARLWAARESRFMRARVIESSSHKSGSSSTTRTIGRGMQCFSGGPALRVGEDDAENTTTALSWLVDQHGAVALTKFARQEQDRKSVV